MAENKPSVGEEARKRLISSDKQEVGETSSEMNKTFEEALMECVRSYQKERLENTTPFYVIFQNKKERLMQNVIRRYFYGRETEPTPTYDIGVYKCDPITQKIDFKWTIPDQATYFDMLINANRYPPEKQQLVMFCKLMSENRLADYQKEVIS